MEFMGWYPWNIPIIKNNLNVHLELLSENAIIILLYINQQ